MGRITVFIAGLLASTLLAGAATAAARTVTVPELAAGPLVVKLAGHPGYRMVVLAASLGGQSVVAVEFVRTQGTAAQTTVYRFGLPQRALRVGRNLVSATLGTGSGLGRFGRIRLTFACRRRAVRAPCLGSSRARSGAVTGVLDFSTGRGRMRARSLPAKLVVKQLALPSSGGGLGIGVTAVPKPDCRQYPHAAVLALISAGTGASSGFGLSAFLAARQKTGPLAVMAAAIRTRPPATEVVGVQATVPRSALRLTGIRTARFEAAGIPFMRGALSFSRSGPLPGCTGRAAIGGAAGSLRLQTDLFGSVALLSAHPGGVLIGPAP